MREGEIRKLRKKLRQIENLERLERDLTKEEREKVSKKSHIRQLLNEKLLEIQVDDIEKATENMKTNLQIKTETTENGENSRNTVDVVNDSPQQRVPVQQTAVLANKLPHEEKLSKNNDEHSGNNPSRSTSPECDSAVKKNVKSSSPRNSDDSVTSKPSSFAQLQTVKESRMKKADSLCDWEEKKFTTKCLEGHNDLISSVEMDGSFLISGSRDTMLKVWDTNTGEEIRSMGGHTGGITSVVLEKKDSQGIVGDNVVWKLINITDPLFNFTCYCR